MRSGNINLAKKDVTIMDVTLLVVDVSPVHNLWILSDSSLGSVPAYCDSRLWLG